MTPARRTVLFRRAVASTLAVVLALPMAQVCEAAPLQEGKVASSGVSNTKIEDGTWFAVERISASWSEAGSSGDGDVPLDSRGDCVCHCPCTCLMPTALPGSPTVVVAHADMPHVAHVHSESAPPSVTRSPLLRPPLD